MAKTINDINSQTLRSTKHRIKTRQFIPFFFPFECKANAITQLRSNVICKLTKFTGWRMLRSGRFSLRRFSGRLNMRTLSSRGASSAFDRLESERASHSARTRSFVFSPENREKRNRTCACVYTSSPPFRVARKDNEETTSASYR